MLADLLELHGAVGDDSVMTKSDIQSEIAEVIISNFLFEAPDIYLRKIK